LAELWQIKEGQGLYENNLNALESSLVKRFTIINIISLIKNLKHLFIDIKKRHFLFFALIFVFLDLKSLRAKKTNGVVKSKLLVN
jgi:hypothetical protein